MKWAVLIPVFLLSVLIGGTHIDGPDEPCPSGWHMHGNHCYKLVETKADWYSAESRCEQYGAQLLSISSEVENIFIDGLISNVRETRVWIGLRDKDRGWYWVDGSELIFTHWADGEPNNNGFLGFFQKDVTCASIYTKATKRRGWNDGMCASEYPFICKLHSYIRQPSSNGTSQV